MPTIGLLFLLLAGALLAACDGSEARGAQDDAAARMEAEGTPAVGGEAAEEASATGPSQGHALYEAHCAVCHGRNGGGGVGPALAGNPNLQVTDYVVAQVLLGGGGMPPFGPRLTEPEIAAVINFVRTSWGNDDYGEVTPAQVSLQGSGLRPGLRLGASPSGVAAEGEGERGLSQGERVFVQQGCSGCHGAEGEGGIGPALAGNESLGNDEHVVEQILQGGGGMPPFADQLDDEEVAAVATHERTAWGNDFGAIEAERVAEARPSQEGTP